LGRDDSPAAFQALVKWVRGAELRRENVIASNNAYDEHYIKYFTGLETGQEIRTFGHTQPHVLPASSSSAAAAEVMLPHFSLLPPNYRTLRHVKYSMLKILSSPSSSPPPSLLIDYGHDHPPSSSVAWRSQLGQQRFASYPLQSSIIKLSFTLTFSQAAISLIL
jgi:hypothetical protein